MHFANRTALATVLFTTLTQNLRLCSFAEAGIVLKGVLNPNFRPFSFELKKN